MAGGGKGGGGGGSGVFDYSGTIAGLVCKGPVDELVSIIIDGKEAWPGSIVWKAGLSATTGQVFQFGGRNWQVLSNHTTSTLNQPPNGAYWTPHSVSRGASNFADITVVGYGTCRIYWGTSAQTQDPSLAAAGNDAGEDHPAYKGMCYIVLKDFLFGRERTSAPNVEIVVHRKPQQSIVTGTPTNLNDGQANLVTALLDAATDPLHGIGLLSSDIDATTMQAVAQTNATNPDAWFGSPLITQQTTLKSLAADLAEIADAHVWLNPSSKKIEAVQFLHGSPPGSYVTLTTDSLVKISSIDCDSWQDTPTGAVVVFKDRERSFKETSDKVDDLRAFAVVGENRRENLSPGSITRRAQALSYASEYLRRYGRPQMEASVLVRREKARNITPGSWVQLDIDLEPNGTQLLQFFKVIEVNIPPRGPVELILDAEETLAPVPYTPAEVIGNVPILGGAEAIPHIRLFEASFALAGGAGQVGCLAERPNLITVGFQLAYNNASTGDFQNLGINNGFAVRAILRSDYSGTATGAVEITVPAQKDISLLSQSLSGVLATDDTLIALVFKISSGQIATDSLGLVHWEIMSVSNIALVSGGNYDLTVSRGRQGTSAHAFVVASTEVWICNRASLSFFFHREWEQLKSNKLNGVTPDTAYFIPQPFTVYDTLDIDLITPTQFDFNVLTPSEPVITITSPAWTSQTYANGSLPVTITIEGNVIDYSANLAEVQVVCRLNGGSEQTIYRVVTGRNSHTFSVNYTIQSSAVGTHQFTVRAITVGGVKSEKTISAIAQAVSVKLPTPFLNFYLSPSAPAPYNASGVGNITSFTTVPRNHWNYTNMRWFMPGYSPDILTTGGTVLIAATSVGTTVAPSSGWISTSNVAPGVSWSGAFSALSSGGYPVYPPAAGEPVPVINAVYTGNAPFKLWWKATNPGDTDSDPAWVIFSG